MVFHGRGRHDHHQFAKESKIQSELTMKRIRREAEGEVILKDI